MASDSVPSPLATGGAGTIYEYQVAAMVLAALLRGDRVEGLDVPVTEVQLQQRLNGHPLDDVVVVAHHPNQQRLTVEFQVKRTLVPTRSNAEWKSVIGQCVAAVEDDRHGVERGHRRLGVIARGPAGQLGELKELTEWVRTQSGPEAWLKVAFAKGAVPIRVRDRWLHLHDTVREVMTPADAVPLADADVDRMAFLVALILHVWVVDVGEGGRDRRETLNRLGDFVPHGQPAAAGTVLLHLAEIAQTRGPHAGGIDRSGLLAELRRRQIQVVVPGMESPPGTLATPSTLPIMNLPPRNPAFTGRRTLLDRLHRRLADLPVPVVAVHGLGGTGKTQLVREYAHQQRTTYTIAWWIRAGSPVTIAADLAALGPQLGLMPPDDQNEAVAGVLATLSQRHQWLLIFDNAPSPASVSRFLPPGDGHVIITSRTRDWGEVAHPVPIGVMTAEEADQYLRARTSRDEPQAVSELAEHLGYLPLALAQAGSYVATYGTSVARYLALYLEAAARLLAAGPEPTGYPATVATTWLLHFEALAGTQPPAIDVLNLCAFLAPDAIPIDLLLTTLEHLPEPLVTAAADPVAREAAVGALVATSLLDRVDDRAVTVHRLVQRVTRDRLPIERQHAWATTAIAVIMATFPDNPDQPTKWSRAATLTAHGLVATRLADDNGATATEPWAGLLNAMGLHLAGLADLTTAETLYEHAIAKKQQVYGPEHPEVAVTLDNLGLLLTRIGKPNQALGLHQRALATKVKALGPTHPTLAVTLANIAAVYGGLGDHDTAQPFLAQALAIDEMAYGPNHPEVAADLRDIGINLTNTGDPDAAIAPLRRALAIYQTMPDNYAPDIAKILDALGVAHQQGGNPSAARDHLEQALAIAEATYGSHHPQTARTLINLGNVLDDLGNYTDARAHLERALQVMDTTHGPEHPDVAIVLQILSVVLSNLGEPDAGMVLLRRAYRILHTAFGPEHPHTQVVAQGLGSEINSL